MYLQIQIIYLGKEVNEGWLLVHFITQSHTPYQNNHSSSLALFPISTSALSSVYLALPLPRASGTNSEQHVQGLICEVWVPNGTDISQATLRAPLTIP